jgi:hypothetical protein
VKARAPWALAAASSALCIAGLVVLFMSLGPQVPPPAWGFRGFTLIFGVSFVAVGFVVARNRPDNSIGWVFLIAGLLASVQFLGEQFADYAYYVRPGATAGHLAAWITGWIWTWAVGLMAIYLLLLYPTGRLLSRRWRPVAWLAPAAIAVASAAIAVSPGRLPNIGIANPFGMRGLPDVNKTLNWALDPLFVLVVLSAVSIAIRAKRSRGVEREQLKWIALAGGGLAVALAITPATNPASSELWEPIAVIVTMSALPVCAGIAIMRYRLYDIDRIISRTLGYAIVTGLLVAAYVGLVVLFQLATRPFTGASSLAVAASTLIVAAAFIPLRRRVQSVVDRRFDRHRYDAARTIDAFTARLRDEIEIGPLTEEIGRVVSDTMAPQHVSVWLR